MKFEVIVADITKLKIAKDGNKITIPYNEMLLKNKSR